MPLLRTLLACLLLVANFVHAEKLTIAAASDLKFAMNEVVAAFEAAHPADEITVIYGSSGQFSTQIQQGAPYDVFFSADISYPEQLAQAGFAARAVTPYAVGRIVIWSSTVDAATLTLESLRDPTFKHIAIANPLHAPYGKRAEEALRAVGVWRAVEGRLVLGENIAQTAQFIDTGAAEVGIIALALALNPELAGKGGYFLIPAELHAPLLQAYVVTKRAANNALAQAFAEFMATPAVREVMDKHGFALPAAH